MEIDIYLNGCTGLTALPDDLEVEGTIYTDFGNFDDVASARRAFEEKFGKAAPQKKSPDKLTIF